MLAIQERKSIFLFQVSIGIIRFFFVLTCPLLLLVLPSFLSVKHGFILRLYFVHLLGKLA